MKQAKELYGVLKGLSDKGSGAVLLGQVKSVNKDKCSCTVTVDGLEIFNVRLKSTMDGGDGFKMFPKKGSDVLIQRISNGQHLVIMFSEIDNVKWNVDNTIAIKSMRWQYEYNGLIIEFDGDESKVQVKNTAYTLLGLIEEFIDICTNEIHMTNSGPTVSLSPTNKLKFETLKKKFSRLLKN